MKHWLCALVASALIGNGAAATETVKAPLWEAGVGMALLTLPAYRGSDKIHHFALPVPYLTYNGDFLKADRHGVRGQLFESDRIDFTISTSASPPSDGDIAARENMPDLKPSVEIGPQLDVTLWRGDGDIAFLKLRLPVRQAFTVSGRPRDIGIIFSPNLNADIRNPFGLSGWTLGMVTGPVYGSKKQHAYFYEVEPQYATTNRQAYEAQGGYAGWQGLLSISKRFTNAWIGAYVRHDTLQGAVFRDSPLVERGSYTSVGLAVSWIIDRSTTMVDVRPN